jgi:endonuclease YncB( thermonuclease family)
MKPTPSTVVLALACLAALLYSSSSLAAELYGRVVGVSDGDTITVLDAEKVTHKIRLSGIDAPEKAQPFGERAKQQLSDWVYQATVRVIHDKTDRYGRIVGKVTLNGEDVNIQMIHAGLAWHYKAYEN